MGNNKINPYMQRSFLICASLLLVFCVSKKVVLAWTGSVLTKTPIDLRKSLDDIDMEQTAPYKVVSKRQIDNKEILESLGTKDYIQWILEDTEVSETSPVRYCDLFITYYGKPDRVPHVPDECYVAAGKERRDQKILSLDIDGKTEPIKINLLVFGDKNPDIFTADQEFSRMYFFKANNDFTCTRVGVRKAMGKNLLGKYSFFSKVEWQFYGGGRAAASEKDIIAASEKLVSKILPVLENEHWPNLEEIEGEGSNESNIKDESKKVNG